MLKPIAELPEQDRSKALLLGWAALDTDSGAYLFRTYGGKTLTAPKYVLILPDEPVAARRSFFANCAFGYPYGRKIVRAWTDEDAIAIANERLPKMIEQQAAAHESQL